MGIFLLRKDWITMTKRRVLIIVENLPVPFDVRVWKEARTLKQHGYEVIVLCPRGKDCRRVREVLEGIRIYRHPAAREASSPIGYVWEYSCALFWQFIFSWWIFLRHRFHVIQGCNPPDDIFLIALPFKFFGVRYVFDQHDVNPELYLAKYNRRDLFYRLQLFLEMLTFRSSDVVISTNNSYRRIAIERGRVRDENVFVVRNGPDPDTFRPVAPNAALKHGKRFLVGYVGTMNAQEGMDILLGAAQELRNRGRDDVYFTCVGTGPGLPDLRRLVRDMKLEDTVTFTGRIPDADMIEILSTADVCVNPDKPSDMNSMSTMIKIMEYMALRKPIVQFEGTEGRFSAQGASLYCDITGNLAANFADKLEWLLDRPEERLQMGEFGRQRVETELAWEYSVQHLLAAYDKAFNGLHQTPPLEANDAQI
jgi:glycosyltransferase involved in cell wall biosynthesis